MISSVLFDLGNVLVRFVPERFWVSLGVQDEAVIVRLGPGLVDLGKLYESGLLETDDFVRRLHAHMKGFDPKRVDEAFQGVLPEPVPGMEDIVRRVEEKCGTGLVSNTSPLHFAHCLRIGPALKHIQRFYLSYDLKVLKPTPEFYKQVLKREGVAGDMVVFIDDVQENVDGAVRAGMLGIRFIGAEALKKELHQLGL